MHVNSNQASRAQDPVAQIYRRLHQPSDQTPVNPFQSGEVESIWTDGLQSLSDVRCEITFTARGESSFNKEPKESGWRYCRVTKDVIDSCRGTFRRSNS